MGVLHQVMLYVNDKDRTGLTGYLTFDEKMFPYLPPSGSRITHGLAPRSDDNSENEQIHVRHV